MNKKAIFNPVEIMIYIVAVIIVALFIAFATFNYLNEKIDTTNLETFLLTKKLVYSDSCLAYSDSTKTYIGIIDLEKLNNERLNNCFTKNNFGYKVSLYDINNKIVKTTSNLNQRQDAYFPICGEVPKHKCLTRKDLVQYLDQGKIKTGLIEIEVINFVG